MAYYMIFVKANQVWTPQFGDSDKECVEFERDDMCERVYEPVSKKDIKIIRFNKTPSNHEVNQKTIELNKN